MNENQLPGTILAAITVIADIVLAVAACSTYFLVRREFALKTPLDMGITCNAKFFKIHNREDAGNLAMGIVIKGVSEIPVSLQRIEYSIFDDVGEKKRSEILLGKYRNSIGHVMHLNRRISMSINPFLINYIPHIGIPVVTVTIRYEMQVDGVNWRTEKWYKQFDIIGCGYGKVRVEDGRPIRISTRNDWLTRTKGQLRKFRESVGGGWPV